MLNIGLYNIKKKERKGLKYRSRVDIVAAMIQSAVGGATKTRLMYSAFLSHSQVEEYLEFLRAKRLISFIPDKKRYVPTDRGLQFLKMYGEIKDTVTIEGTPGLPATRQPERPKDDALDAAARHPEEGVKAARDLRMDEL
jgi:predicted transcriptional regulator